MVKTDYRHAIKVLYENDTYENPSIPGLRRDCCSCAMSLFKQTPCVFHAG